MSSNVDTSLLQNLGLMGKNGSASSSSVSASSTGSSANSSAVNQDQFLKLMMTELKNQDPTQPMDSGQFLTQIAQFTQASGIQDLQKSFSSFADSMKSNQVLQASGLIGHTVLVKPALKNGQAVAQLDATVGLGGAVNLPQAAQGVGVDIYDIYGQRVKHINIGDHAAGQAYFAWDGTRADGSTAPPGEYTIAASATIGGSSQALDTLVADTVGSVDLGRSGSGSFTVNLSGLGPTDFSKITQVM